MRRLNNFSPLQPETPTQPRFPSRTDRFCRHGRLCSALTLHSKCCTNKLQPKGWNNPLAAIHGGARRVEKVQ
jgi:hypothetical protein